MAIDIKGPWDQQETANFLAKSDFPVRLSCIGSDGYPRVLSLWYRYYGGHIQSVTHKDAQVSRMLRANPKAGFEISPNEPPYYGVRGQGTAELTPLGDVKVLEDLIQGYLGGLNSTLANWLLSRSADEVLVTVKPHRLYTWDYRDRMADAVQ